MRTLIVASIGLTLSVGANAQQAGVTRLADSTVARVDRAFLVAGGASAPGCAVGLARDGQVVLTRAYGLANLEDAAPNTPETIFESGSVAKQFTASAVLLLVYDGKLSLDDDIRKYLPEMHDFGHRITVRNLLSHTSGLRDWYALAAFRGQSAGKHAHDFASILDIASHQTSLNFEPGAEYLYSNTGYILAALIVQRVSGMPFPAFTKERIFTPLGMTHTQWRDDFTKVVKGRASAYDGNATRGYTQDMPFTNVIGSGGLLTTVGDWLTWNAFLENPTALPGGVQLVQSMTTQMTLNSGKRIAYALGVSVTQREGMKEISHSGSTGGYRTWLARYPEEKAQVAVLCNAGSGINPTTAGTASLLAMLGRDSRPVQLAGAIQVPTAELKKYEGVYRGPDPERVVKFVVRDTVLISVPSNRPLVPIAADRFRFAAAELSFERNGSKVSRVRWMAGIDTLTYVPDKESTPTTRQLAAYAGSYWSPDLEARVTVEVRDSVLVLKQRPNWTITLRPTIADTFDSNVGTFQFSRGSNGAVTGVGLWADRVRNVRFSKEK